MYTWDYKGNYSLLQNEPDLDDLVQLKGRSAIQWKLSQGDVFHVYINQDAPSLLVAYRNQSTGFTLSEAATWVAEGILP